MSVLAASTLISASPAGAAPRSGSMIEIGAGAASLGDTTPIEALIRVRAESSSNNGVFFADRLVVIKIEADGTIGAEGVRYIDFDFEAFTNEWTGRNKYTYLGIAGITGSLDRNLPINQNMTLSLNFLGLRGGIGGRISPDVVAYLHGAVDLLGIAYSERLRDGEQLSLFGHAQYTVYSVLSETGKFTGSIDSTFQFFLGVNYKY